MLKDLMDEASEVVGWQARVNDAQKVLVVPMRFFDLETYSL